MPVPVRAAVDAGGATLIIKAALPGDGAAFETRGDSGVDGVLGNIGPDIGRAAQGRGCQPVTIEIGVRGIGVVAPSALFVVAFQDALGVEDNAHGTADGGLGELLAMLVNHAVWLRTGRRCRCHVRTWGGSGRARRNQAAGLLEDEDGIDGVIEVVAVGALARSVAAGHEGHGCQSGDGGGGGFARAAGSPGAVGFLGMGEGGKAAIDGALDGVRDGLGFGASRFGGWR